MSKIEWISVDERMPEPEDVVVVTGKPYSNRGFMIALANFNYDEWAFMEDSFGWFNIHDESDVEEMDTDDQACITHWCKVPELPDVAQQETPNE